MKRQDIYLTDTALDSFREIIARTQEVSLISAEKTRRKILHKLHFIHHHPDQGTRKVDFMDHTGNFRFATVLNYKIYFVVREDGVVILDMLVDKSKKEGER